MILKKAISMIFYGNYIKIERINPKKQVKYTKIKEFSLTVIPVFHSFHIPYSSYY